MVHRLNINTEDLLRICKIHGTGKAGRAAIAQELGMSVHTAKRYITERGIVGLLRGEKENGKVEEGIKCPNCGGVTAETIEGITHCFDNCGYIRLPLRLKSDVDEMMEMVPDMINNPPHYTTGKLETIDIIQDKLTPEEFEGFCKGVIIQYVIRSKIKGGVESLEKAAWYLRKLIEVKKCG